MSGLMARIRRRRADELPPASVATDAAEVVARPAPEASGADQPTAVVPVPAEAETVVAADAPAGADPVEVREGRAGFRERSRMRRRLRYLRRLRELGFRDIGGLVFDLDRFGRDRQDLVRAKLDALAAVDTELRVLEAALDDVRPLHELHEPGVAACPRCGGLHGTEASFCPSCGLHLRGPRTVGDVAGPALPAADAPAGEDETTEPAAIESASGATSEAQPPGAGGPTVATGSNGSGPAHDEPGGAPATDGGGGAAGEASAPDPAR